MDLFFYCHLNSKRIESFQKMPQVRIELDQVETLLMALSNLCQRDEAIEWRNLVSVKSQSLNKSEFWWITQVATMPSPCWATLHQILIGQRIFMASAQHPLYIHFKKSKKALKISKLIHSNVIWFQSPLRNCLLEEFGAHKITCSWPKTPF